jgi:hypothetical protein
MKPDNRTTAAEEQYTAGFLAGCFGLTLKEARQILSKAGQDRTTAAELARKTKAGSNN